MRNSTFRLAGMGRVLSFFASVAVFTSISASAQVNSWVNPTSGKWEDASSWSRGVPPASSQTVEITNPGFKAVNIDSATVSGSPGSLTIDDLAVSGPTNGLNTVLLNFSGTGTPLKVLNECDIDTNGIVNNLSGSFEVDGNAGGQLLINGGIFTQNGGVTVVKGPLFVENGSFNATNGNITLGNVTVAGPQFAQSFNQDGGSVLAQSVAVTNGTYTLTSGTLYALNGTEIDSVGAFVQSNGTNYGDIRANGINPGSYTIDGGLAQGNVLTVNGSFYQGGGVVNMQTVDWSGNNGNVLALGTLNANVFNVHGNALVSFGQGNITLGTVNTGSLSVSNSAIISLLGYNLDVTNIVDVSGDSSSTPARLEVEGSTGTSSTVQFGTVNLWPNSSLIESYHTDLQIANMLNLAGGQFALSGGTLNCLGIYVGPNSRFTQSGGENYVNATLSINGGTYEESSGYAIMDALYLHGSLLLDTNPLPVAFSFTNLGTVDFGGYLGIGMTNDLLGQVQLSSNATVAFIGGPAVARFGASSNQSWLPGVLMTVSNWNNSGNTQIFFGTDASGLSTSQLAQIQFSNPGGFAPGVYTTKILGTGEVVPDQVVSSTTGTLNSWINASSGNWGDPTSWSLGIAPASSQSIYIANPSFKAVTLNSATVSAEPQSLHVNSVAITSASSGTENTFNTLLLNYAGAGNPLVIGVDSNSPGSLYVGTNSAVTMFSSGLIVNDSLVQTNSRLGEFEVDGSFNQSDNSEVVAGFLDLHTNGTYSLTNGMVFIGTQFIDGKFNQDGGTNVGTVMLSTNGDYELYDGAFHGNINFVHGIFEQWGGTVSAQVNYGDGLYKLTGGTLLPGDLNLAALPVTNLDLIEPPFGNMEQSGGTNSPTSLEIGFGSYTLSSNGVVNTPTMTLTTNAWAGGLYSGDFEQSGGYVTNGALIMIGGTNVDNHNTVTRVAAKYNLYSGTLVTPSITTDIGDFGQSGGTNIVGTLSMNGSIYNLGNGLLEANQIQLTGGSQFWHMGGTVGGAPNITMANGTWAESTTAVHFGQLNLSSGNSVLGMPSGSGVVQFANSSGASWAGNGTLYIVGWNGSLSGGGAQQVFFGTSSSGLTAQQLSQVQFSSPAGLPSGMYSAEILSDGEVVPNAGASTSGPVNSWTNSASGNWDDASSWSLGILPNSSQSVLIANAGSKTVSINSSTPVNFPGSMTVTNLFIQGTSNTVNTLLLNNFGTGVPLTVLNGLTLQNNGQIVDFNSGLNVQGGTFLITNSAMIQDGGFVRATNGPIYFSSSQYTISNGVFQAGSLSIGYPVSAQFNQYGGSVTIASLGLDSSIYGPSTEGISLYGGTLNLPGGMFPDAGSYLQTGGTNYTTQIYLERSINGAIPGFTLNGGLLADSGVSIYGGPTINQNGGTHVSTNGIGIAGERITSDSNPGTYNMNGGTLVASSIELDGDMGDALFNETNGTVTVGTVNTSSGGYFSENNTYVTLSGGTLSCLNYTNTDGNGQLNQSGGTLVVSNLLEFGGSRYVGVTLYGTYTLSGGTLAASNIDISGVFSIGDGTSNRISNPGTFTLSHKLSIGNAVEQLGHFILSGTNATIDLAGSASKLSFANSSGQAWAGGATLTILDWNGNASGGGTEQLKFGTGASGLTGAQLSQIQFTIGTNNYSAKILATGEVVPNQAVGPSVAYSTQGHNFVVTWPTGWTLQSATNAPGPYTDVPGATSPYTNDMTLQPNLFFRLRQ